jgi:hypothetical protein
LENWFEAEFILLKVLKLQPSELDKLEFYRAEILMENLKQFNEEEEGGRKKEQEQQEMPNTSSDAERMMRNAQKSMSAIQTPSMPNFKMPNLPNFKL